LRLVSEIIKPALSGAPEEACSAVTSLGDLFEGSLRLLSPFMPFITEEVWHAMYDGKPPAKIDCACSLSGTRIALAQRSGGRANDVLQDLIEKVRNMRAEMKVETES